MSGLPEEAYWVAFNHLPGVGPRRFTCLLRHFGNARQAWLAPAAAFARVFPPGLAERLAAARAGLSPAACWEEVGRKGLGLVLRSHDAYPPRLAGIDDPPFVLYYRGTLPAEEPAVAVVGSRRATPYGLAVAEKLGHDLARAGVWVVSGLARGVDMAAHRGALAAGGRTVAILGSGLNRIYPPEARSLARSIAEAGSVVSEFPPAAAPLAGNFPARNRIISGLSLGVVVVEGGRQSGALITADMAAEQGREVLAVPGPVTSEASRGPHALLRDGAALVESAADVLETLGLPLPVAPSTASLPEPDREERLLLAALGLEPRLPEELAAATGLAPGLVLALLLALETSGRVRRAGAGYVALAAGP